jgi:hypothetical protein
VSLFHGVQQVVRGKLRCVLIPLLLCFVGDERTTLHVSEGKSKIAVIARCEVCIAQSEVDKWGQISQP